MPPSSFASLPVPLLASEPAESAAIDPSLILAAQRPSLQVLLANLRPDVSTSVQDPQSEATEAAAPLSGHGEFSMPPPAPGSFIAEIKREPSEDAMSDQLAKSVHHQVTSKAVCSEPISVLFAVEQVMFCYRRGSE